MTKEICICFFGRVRTICREVVQVARNNDAVTTKAFTANRMPYFSLAHTHSKTNPPPDGLVFPGSILLSQQHSRMIPVVNDENFRIDKAIAGEGVLLTVLRLLLFVNNFLLAVLGRQGKNLEVVLSGYLHFVNHFPKNQLQTKRNFGIDAAGCVT